MDKPSRMTPQPSVTRWMPPQLEVQRESGLEKATVPPLPASYDLTAAYQLQQRQREEMSRRQMGQRLAKIGTGWQNQLDEHQRAMIQTVKMFEQVLDALPQTCQGLQAGLGEPAAASVTSRVDGDRSVGIMNLLWHTVSLTLRGNHYPLLLPRPGRSPFVCGRILALHGNLMDPLGPLYGQGYPTLLTQEIASLYVSADPNAPVVLLLPFDQGQDHSKEIYLYPHEAPCAFLTAVIERLAQVPYCHESL